MASNERHYDFGLRGYAETTSRQRMTGLRHPYSQGDRFGGGPGPRDRRMEPRTPRVTTRYNRDYVYGARGEENYPRNSNVFTGDRPRDIGDDRYYRRPYTTIGGTRTFRGAHEPTGYGRDFDGYDRDLRRR